MLHQAGVNTLDGASYTYDPAGNRTSKGNYLNGITSNYTYDQLYELTQVTQGGGTTESYSYDAVGNRLSSSGVPTYSYNASNELTSNSTGSYTYDANGNTLSDPSGKSYTWDFENRLTQAVVPGTNGGTTTFKYDPFGRRIQKSGPLGTTNYLYDRHRLVDELAASGSVLASYAEGLRIDEPFAELRSGATGYYDADDLGSITSLTNASGTTTDTLTYDSFGQTTSTGTVQNPLQFVARESDSETGLYYYRFRYYDPKVGRFISEDPSEFRGGRNFYTYVGNNPLVHIDPFGLSQQDVQRIINTAQQVTDEMTAEGERTDPGWWNNFWSTVGSETGDPAPLLGCGEQAYKLELELEWQQTADPFDDTWTFIDQERGMSWPLPPYPLPHQWVVAKSSNPSDPLIVLDPYNNKFYPVDRVTGVLPDSSNPINRCPCGNL